MVCMPWKEPICWKTPAGNQGSPCNSGLTWLVIAAAALIVLVKGNKEGKK